jgi:hypothetical protein
MKVTINLLGHQNTSITYLEVGTPKVNHLAKEIVFDESSQPHKSDFYIK